ncbi:FAD-linked sulfhydryl oxidase ERV1-like isoform X2 [Vicia villosa]|uniref:FAD-linked sulfhydryl oxidase ERV1-like isoform X2 n=1 Tax=Vicia villosa TaxID=3911 RepID=UPI00273B4BBA|nr:FAD-linked sulfhydryl oxidase ERV1-like isoform X2 [Vicia villosa]
MSENPVQALFYNFEKVASFVQHHVSNFIGHHIQSSGTGSVNASIKAPVVKTTSSGQPRGPVVKGKSSTPVTKEELGRATWTFLHTLAAQYPDNPTRQQKKDVKELVQILSRMYPCSECADHFKEVLSIGKPAFPCERVDARWGKLECEQKACEIIGSTSIFN